MTGISSSFWPGKRSGSVIESELEAWLSRKVGKSANCGGTKVKFLSLASLP